MHVAEEEGKLSVVTIKEAGINEAEHNNEAAVSLHNVVKAISQGRDEVVEERLQRKTAISGFIWSNTYGKMNCFHAVSSSSLRSDARKMPMH